MSFTLINIFLCILPILLIESYRNLFCHVPNPLGAVQARRTLPTTVPGCTLLDNFSWADVSISSITFLF